MCFPLSSVVGSQNWASIQDGRVPSGSLICHELLGSLERNDEGMEGTEGEGSGFGSENCIVIFLAVYLLVLLWSKLFF